MLADDQRQDHWAAGAGPGVTRKPPVTTAEVKPAPLTPERDAERGRDDVTKAAGARDLSTSAAPLLQPLQAGLTPLRGLLLPVISLRTRTEMLSFIPLFSPSFG